MDKSALSPFLTLLTCCNNTEDGCLLMKHSHAQHSMLQSLTGLKGFFVETELGPS